MSDIERAEEKNYFTELNDVNVSDHIEKKNGLSYVSWVYAWGELKKRYPDAFYTIYENESGWNYFTDGRTCWVKTGVTVNGMEIIEYLPIMDFKNKSIPVDSVTSMDVNKAIQRSITKAIARHGLGLYIYAGEDLPEVEQVSTSGVDYQAKISEKDLEILRKTLQPHQMDWVLKNCGIETLADLTNEQFGEVMRALAAKEKNGSKGAA